MRPRIAHASLVLGLAALLAACGGPVRRVSEPAAQIQQLTVRADGRWDVDLRLQNYSSIPMRFDTLRLALSVGGEAAGELRATPALGVGPESADVVTVQLAPSAAAKLVVADALAARRSLPYTLSGDVTATPDEAAQRSFDIERSSALTPAPGLPGVLR
ncbi:MAG: LEA type 2 family protein [Pseudomonadota bacterium]